MKAIPGNMITSAFGTAGGKNLGLIMAVNHNGEVTVLWTGPGKPEPKLTTYSPDTWLWLRGQDEPVQVRLKE